MKKELILKKCNKCDTLIKIIKKDTSIICCEEEMHIVKPNSVDASFEKHIPTYTVSGNKITVCVNHVMDIDHYIEFITMITDNKEETYYFNPNDKLEVQFEYIKGSKLYSYCNKHGLWVCEVK